MKFKSDPFSTDVIKTSQPVARPHECLSPARAYVRSIDYLICFGLNCTLAISVCPLTTL